MTTERVAGVLARHALAMPEAWEDHPWEGDRVAKVREFRCRGAQDTAGAHAGLADGLMNI